LGGYTITVCNQPTRSTQPCIPPGSLNRVLASAGGKDWNVNSAGWQVTLFDPIWHVNSSRGVATSVSELLYPYYLFTYFTGTRGLLVAAAAVNGVNIHGVQQRHRQAGDLDVRGEDGLEYDEVNCSTAELDEMTNVIRRRTAADIDDDTKPTRQPPHTQ